MTVGLAQFCKGGSGLSEMFAKLGKKRVSRSRPTVAVESGGAVGEKTKLTLLAEVQIAWQAAAMAKTPSNEVIQNLSRCRDF